jgi:hypothetical protein
MASFSAIHLLSSFKQSRCVSAKPQNSGHTFLFTSVNGNFSSYF